MGFFIPVSVLCYFVVILAVALVAVLVVALVVADHRVMSCLGVDCTHNESDDGEDLHIRSLFHCLGSRCQFLKVALTPSPP